MNQVSLVGRITRDLELRNTSNGQGKFVSFTVAVSEFSNQKEITNFIPCFAFDRTAENMVKYLSKGSLVSVTGRINVRTNQNDGKYETIVSVSADRVNFLESAKNRSTNQSIPNDFIKSNVDLDSPINNFTSSTNDEDEVILSDDESIL